VEILGGVEAMGLAELSWVEPGSLVEGRTGPRWDRVEIVECPSGPGNTEGLAGGWLTELEDRLASEMAEVTVVTHGVDCAALTSRWWESLFSLLGRGTEVVWVSGEADGTSACDLDILTCEVGAGEILALQNGAVSWSRPLGWMAGINPSVRSVFALLTALARAEGRQVLSPERLPARGELRPLLLRGIGGRSGTSMLMALLGTSTSVVVEGEHPFEVRMYSYLYRMAHLLNESYEPGTDPEPVELFRAVDRSRVIGPLPWDLPGISGSCLAERSFGALWDCFAEEVVAAHGIGIGSQRGTSARGKYWAEKAAFPWLDPVRPGRPVRVIQVVRDPRDVWVSANAFNPRMRGLGRLPAETDWDYLHRFARNARRALSEHIRSDRGAESAVVRYEDLVADPWSECRRLGAWLGISLDPRALEELARSHAEHLTSSSPLASIGRWREELGRNEAAVIWDVAGDVMSCLGYEED
jgi:hypothetical protein